MKSKRQEKILELIHDHSVQTQEQLLDACPLYWEMWQAHIGAKNWAVSSAAKEA